MREKSHQLRLPDAPAPDLLPLVNASPDVARWLEHYWNKLRLPVSESFHLAVTEDRSEFHRWTGRRLNPLALGCYCYLPSAHSPNGEDSAMLTAPALAPNSLQPALPGFGDLPTQTMEATDAAQTLRHKEDEESLSYWHLVFVEPDLLPLGIEVTVAHELIHLSDRVQGNPRKHRCHGYDSISVDEAAITERDPELLRALLREESTRREETLRRVRPQRYIYVCPQCQREYPRARRYSRPVSCGRCDRTYNAAFLLELREILPK